jgi:hypothetical protein
MQVEMKEIFRRHCWLSLFALGFVFLLLVPSLQRAFWLTQCFEPIPNVGWVCPGMVAFGWNGLQWPFPVETALCIGVVLLGATIAYVGGADLIIEKIRSSLKTRRIWFTAFTIVAAMLVPLSAAWFVLDRFPNSGDEFSYLFQARTFAGFRLWENPPILGNGLTPNRIYILDSKWISQYPPGWPIVLSAALLLGLPAWILNAFLGAGSVAALTTLCNRVGDRSATVVAVSLFTLTPFYVMNAASYFPHIFSSLLILFLCLCLLPDGEIPRGRNLIAAGAIIGMLAMTRYFDVLPLLPALLFWLAMYNSTTWPRIFGLMAAGFIPFLGLLMIYQDLITGSPFRSTYFVINTPEIFPSFTPHSLSTGAKMTVTRLAELALWTSPILLFAYFACLLSKFRASKLAYYDLIFPSFVLAYVTFNDLGGNRYGPRYFFDAFPLLVVTIVTALPSLSVRLSKPVVRAVLPIVSVACLLYLVATWPLVLSGFRREVWLREEPSRLVAQAMLTNAVVIQESWDQVRNPPSMDSAVLYARSTVDIDALRKAFPERSIWRYGRPDPTGPGQLIRVTP